MKSLNPEYLYIIGQLGRGGAEQQLYYLLSELPIQATVLSLSSGGFWADPIRRLGHEVIELKRIRRMELSRLLSTIKVIRRKKPDVIHIFLDGVSALYSRFAGILFSNSIIVIGERNLPVHYPKWYRFILPFINRYVSCVVCNSRKSFNYHATYKLTPSDHLYYIPNAVDARHDINITDRDFQLKSQIVGIVGRLTYQKNPLLFIEMAARVHEKKPDVRFWMVGDGSMREECEAKVELLNLGNIIKFWGIQKNVQELLNKMDIFCLTSIYEGTPNALLEAMAVGLPCVVTDAGDSGDIVKYAGSGFVVESGDVGSFSQAIMKFLGEPEMRKSMGKAGYDYIQNNHTPAEMASKYLDLYAKVSEQR